MKKKIYIAGKVTGELKHTTALKFATAKKEIEALGFEAINPIEVVGDWNMSWELAMRKCIAALMECDAIIMFDNWSNSPGARVEFNLAGKINMPAFRYSKGGIEVLKKHSWNN